MTDIDNLPHFVYRYYAADGQALYVGCTSNVAKREAQHTRKESVQENKQWTRTQRRLRESKYRAARRAS